METMHIKTKGFSQHQLNREGMEGSVIRRLTAQVIHELSLADPVACYLQEPVMAAATVREAFRPFMPGVGHDVSTSRRMMHSSGLIQKGSLILARIGCWRASNMLCVAQATLASSWSRFVGTGIRVCCCSFILPVTMNNALRRAPAGKLSVPISD